MITTEGMNPNWDELPIWAALMIINTADGLLPRHNPHFAWEWSTFTRETEPLIIVRSKEFRYMVRKGARWVI